MGDLVEEHLVRRLHLSFEVSLGQVLARVANLLQEIREPSFRDPEVALFQAQRSPDGGKTSPAEQGIVRLPWPDLGGGPRGNMLQRS